MIRTYAGGVPLVELLRISGGLLVYFTSLTEMKIPTGLAEWYFCRMSGNYFAKVGNKGRVVIPAGLRESQQWDENTVLAFVEDGDEVRIVNRDELLASIRAQLAGTHPVDELLAERRAESARDDAK